MLVFVHYWDLMQEVNAVTVEGGMMHKPEGVHYPPKTASALSNIVMEETGTKNVYLPRNSHLFFVKFAISK